MKELRWLTTVPSEHQPHPAVFGDCTAVPTPRLAIGLAHNKFQENCCRAIPGNWDMWCRWLKPHKIALLETSVIFHLFSRNTTKPSQTLNLGWSLTSITPLSMPVPYYSRSQGSAGICPCKTTKTGMHPGEVAHSLQLNSDLLSDSVKIVGLWLHIIALLSRSRSDFFFLTAHWSQISRAVHFLNQALFEVNVIVKVNPYLLSKT